MSSDLERIITELEALTARMLATTCWEETGEFGECSASRRALAAVLTDRQDLDASAAERIRAVIRAGDGLVARVTAMRKSVLSEIAEAEAQSCFTRELGATMPSHARTLYIDLGA
jgi:hypothetical protein